MLRGPGERGIDNGRPSGERDRRLDDVRANGYAAYLHHDWDVAVLDLAFDTLVDGTDGSRSRVRRLRFAGYDCVLDVEVRGEQLLLVDLRVSPAGQVAIESRTPGASGPTRILSSRGYAQTRVRPQITSFLVHWPTSTRAPVRSAWVLL